MSKEEQATSQKTKTCHRAVFCGRFLDFYTRYFFAEFGTLWDVFGNACNHGLSGSKYLSITHNFDCGKLQSYG